MRDRPYSMKDCVVWARKQMQALFHDDIKQLLHNFPADMVTDVGTKFWSGPKRAPAPVAFDPSDDMQVDFIQAAASLYASVHGLTPVADRQFYRDVAVSVDVAPFTPKVRHNPHTSPTEHLSRTHAQHMHTAGYKKGATVQSRRGARYSPRTLTQRGTGRRRGKSCGATPAVVPTLVQLSVLPRDRCPPSHPPPLTGRHRFPANRYLA